MLNFYICDSNFPLFFQLGVIICSRVSDFSMDNSHDPCNIEDDGDERNNDTCCTSSPSTSSSYRLFGRQSSIHQIMGGGKGKIRLSVFKLENCIHVRMGE